MVAQADVGILEAAPRRSLIPKTNSGRPITLLNKGCLSQRCPNENPRETCPMKKNKSYVNSLLIFPRRFITFKSGLTKKVFFSHEVGLTTLVETVIKANATCHYSVFSYT